MSGRQLLAKRIGLVALANLLVELNSLIMLPLLTKSLPVSEYGVWVQISVTIGLIPAIVLLGFPQSMIRFLPSAQKNDRQEIFYSMASITVLAGLLASVAIFLLAQPIASAIFDGRQNIVQILSALVFLECLISIPFAYFRSVQQIKKYSIFNFVKVSFSLLLVVLLVLSGKGIVGAAIGLLVANTITFLAMGLFVFMDLGFSLPKFKNIREYLAFGLPTMPLSVSGWIVNSSDRYVIGLLLGTAFVGYYSPGYTLGNMITLFMTPISIMLPATLAKYYDDHDIDEVKTILGLSQKYFLALGIPAAFGLSVLSLPILSIISTPDIAAHGYLITPIVALGALFQGAYAISAQVMIVEKNTFLTGKIWMLSALSNLGLNFLLVPSMGITGAAITTLIAFAFSFILTWHYANRSLKIQFDHHFVLKSLTASIIMSLLLLIYQPEGALEVILSIAFGVLVYFVALFLLRGFTFAELDFIRKMIQT